MSFLIIGEVPGWLISLLNELGIKATKLSDCAVEGPAVVIIGDGVGECRLRGTIALSLGPMYMQINRFNARAVLSRCIRLLEVVSDDPRRSLLKLGFVKFKIKGLLDDVEFMPDVEVKPRMLYTVSSLTSDRIKVGLGRGTARGSIYLDSGLVRDLSGELFITQGDLVNEVQLLSKLTNLNFVEF